MGIHFFFSLRSFLSLLFFFLRRSSAKRAYRDLEAYRAAEIRGVRGKYRKINSNRREYLRGTAGSARRRPASKNARTRAISTRAG